jgi:membrane protein YqaA with SNARE-associated domain
MKHIGKVQGAIAFTILSGFFAVIWALIYVKTSGVMNEAMLIMVGSLGTMAGGVVNYYFGSSSGSARKDEIMASQGKELPP